MDAIALYQNNFKTVVAPLGTALTSNQLQRAWKVCESPIIMFDGDEAGQKASQRVSLLALNHLLPDLSLRFCILPRNCDPDDFLTNNTTHDLRDLIENSFSLSDFIWRNEISKEDISTPEKKAGFEKRIKLITKNISNTTVRDYYSSYFRDKLNTFKYPNRSLGEKSFEKNNYRISKEIFASERLEGKCTTLL